MASAYTPGLTVSGDITIRRTRRLPIKGDVLVKVSDSVNPDQVVAQAKLPGILQNVKMAERLGVEPKEIKQFLELKEGDSVEKGQILVEKKGFLGIFGKHIEKSDYAGTIETISEVSGHVLIREPSIPIDLTAYVQGKIVDIIPDEGVIVETRGAMVQGIFGVGGEKTGIIRVAVDSPDQTLTPDLVKDTDKGMILVGGSGVTYETLERVSAVGAAGIVVGGVKDSDLVKYLGYDIGVAITGQEAINFTLVVTEGFGFLRMAQRTFELLKSLQGSKASINGATQIRAGVIRPEVIVPLDFGDKVQPRQMSSGELTIGTPIRVIREPYFGSLGAVTGLPAQLVRVDSETEVRVLNAKLEDGRDVTVPRANVEIIAT